MGQTERLATKPEAQVGRMEAAAAVAVIMTVAVLLAELEPLVAVQAQVVAEAEKVALEVLEESEVLAELEVFMYYLLLLHMLANLAVKVAVEAVGLLLAVEAQETQVPVLQVLVSEMEQEVPERQVVHAVVMLVVLAVKVAMVAEQQVLFC